MPSVSRVIRVVPDVASLEKSFDYLIDDSVGERAATVRVGTIVRVPLHGRRVRGWVTATDVTPDTGPEKLKPISTVVSAGPPPAIVDLCRWTARQYCGSFVHTLRAASPPNNVDPERVGNPGTPNRAFAYPAAHTVVAPGTDRRQLIANLIAPTGSTIVITPAPARTKPLVAFLRAQGKQVIAAAGADTDAVRTRAWLDATRGRCVVIGGRSAVFAPIPDLEAVVLLDDFDEALAEARVPTWNARAVAAQRARNAHAPLSIVTPVPTPDGVAVAGAPTPIDRPALRAGWPVLDVVDMRENPGRGLLTDPLTDALHRTLAHGAKALCIVNRKGRAQLLRCDACDAVAQCELCSAAVVEADDAGLVCVRCDTRRPRVCLDCGSMKLKRLRPGVTRLAEEVGALIPSATVADVDASTDGLPDANVLVGTESLLHRYFKRGQVGLVAFLDFDQELLAPRLHASQQALVLCSRAARLLGGRAGNGRLLLQTRLPEHVVIEAVGTADPLPVLEETTVLVRDLHYPPFGGLARVSGDAAACAQLAADLRAAGVDARGPADDGRYQVRAATAPALADAIDAVIATARALGRIRIEVDPVRI